MLVQVYTCQNALLLEITCHGSNFLLFFSMIVSHSQLNLSGFEGKVEEANDMNGDLDVGINEKMIEDIGGKTPALDTRCSHITLYAPIATKVVCFSRLLKCIRSLNGKQCGPRSGCSYRSSLFWDHAVCFYT